MFHDIYQYCISRDVLSKTDKYNTNTQYTFIFWLYIPIDVIFIDDYIYAAFHATYLNRENPLLPILWFCYYRNISICYILFITIFKLKLTPIINFILLHYYSRIYLYINIKSTIIKTVVCLYIYIFRVTLLVTSTGEN